MKDKLLRIGQSAEFLGVHINTLRVLHAKGILIPAVVTKGGTRYYSEQQLYDYIGQRETHPRKIIGYCRVSSTKQKTDLERQQDRLELYMLSRGYQFEIISDIGSGINYKKQGLNQMLRMICNKEVEKVVVLYRDRLLRFGFELLESVCLLHGTQIEIVDNSFKTNEQELVDDLVQIITVFSCQLQGKRAKKTKELIKQLTEKEQ